MSTIGYDDFIRLCRVIPDMSDSLSELKKAEIVDAALNGGWDPCITIRRDGVYFRPPEDEAHLAPAELAALYDCPITDPDRPALVFPCSPKQFEVFLEGYGLYGCVDPFDMAEWQAEQIVRSGGVKKQARQEQAILAAVRARGIDPTALPPYKRDGTDIKTQIRLILMENRALFGSHVVFDKAWERLRAARRLSEL